MKKIKLNLQHWNLKQTGIWLVVLFMGITGFIFLIDQSPTPLNQHFNTYDLIRPEFDYAYQTQIYGIPTYTAKQDLGNARSHPPTSPFTLASCLPSRLCKTFCLTFA